MNFVQEQPLESILFFDVETVELLPDGSTKGSTEFYRDNFRIDSAAVSWFEGEKIKSVFVRGENEVRQWLLENLNGRPVVAHNIQFEIGVAKCRLPDVEINWYADTMRLALNYDNGGRKDDYDTIYLDDDLDLFASEEMEEKEIEVKTKQVSLAGLGLAKCGMRILGDREDHKKEAHDWIRENVPEAKKGKEGAYLDKLPLEILARYNQADTEITARLYKHITEYFKGIKFDWAKDHILYLHTAFAATESKIRGVKVERGKLIDYRNDTVQEIDDIAQQFIKKFETPIKLVERDRLLKEVRKRKTLKGRKKYVKRTKAEPARWQKDIAFNVGSNKQLESLFVDKLNIKPQFRTKKGSASFKSSHLFTYGEGGKILEKRRKRLIVQKQSDRLLEKSEYDDRWHIDIRVCGTKTGRLAGAGGLNVQALARRDAGLMSRLVADPGHVFVSQDASAGEPTIITEYTGDLNYRYFCFDGVGKKPFYRNGVLMIDDIYLAYASVCPLFRDTVAKAFNDTYNGRSFADQWVIDSEVIKGHPNLKWTRKQSKWMALAFGYQLGIKTLLEKAIEAGIPNVDRRIAKKCYEAYWQLFNGIREYGKKVEASVKRLGYLVNPFGYRFIPEVEYKSFNGLVQSSVSSLFHWYGMCMKERFPEALYVVTIHDENIYMCPKDRIDDFRKAQQDVAKHMNDTLKWSVKLRFGFVEGNNLYEAK